MKICFISLKAYPIFNPEVEATIGGAEVQLHMLAIELAKKKDLDVHFIVADYGQEKMGEYKGVKVWRSLDFKSRKLSQIWRFFKVFNRIDADVYVQRTLTVESGLIALYSKLRRKKFVYMVAHDSETDGTHPLYKSKIKSFLAELAFKLADVVFVQNEYEKECLSNQISVEKTFLLKKGLDLSKVESNSNKKYDAIWVGRSEEWKNPNVFLKLARENPDYRFMMICPRANNIEKKNYDKLVRETKEIKNLKFLKFVKYHKVYKYFSISKIFVITSSKEGDWPMVVLEAASSGLPILSLSLNYDGLIEEYSGGVHCCSNFSFLNNKFRELMNKEVEIDYMSRNAKRYIVERHSITVNANKFLNIIYEI